jgi:hypothetical protein
VKNPSPQIRILVLSCFLFFVCSLYCGNEYSKGLISYALFLNSFQLSTAFVSIMEKKNAWQIMRNGSSQKECRLCILPVRIDFYNWHDLLNVKIRT